MGKFLFLGMFVKCRVEQQEKEEAHVLEGRGEDETIILKEEVCCD
jgi:hypothetical protein